MSLFPRFVCLSLLLLLGPGIPPTGQAAGPGEYQVKAAFLYHFANFVSWPTSTFEATDGQLRICLIGDDPFGQILDRTFANKSVGEHAFDIRRNPPTTDLLHCHMLYVPDTELSSFSKMRQHLTKGEVLAIGETREFLEQGGMVQFFMKDSKVKFAVNPDAINETKLTVSSKLLRLATIVSP